MSTSKILLNMIVLLERHENNNGPTNHQTVANGRTSSNWCRYAVLTYPIHMVKLHEQGTTWNRTSICEPLSGSAFEHVITSERHDPVEIPEHRTALKLNTNRTQRIVIFYASVEQWSLLHTVLHGLPIWRCPTLKAHLSHLWSRESLSLVGDVA